MREYIFDSVILTYSESDKMICLYFSQTETCFEFNRIQRLNGYLYLCKNKCKCTKTPMNGLFAIKLFDFVKKVEIQHKIKIYYNLMLKSIYD